MIQLITRQDIATYAQISDTVLDNVLNQHINNAQFVDVQKLMGADFYNDMIRNSTDANYIALLTEADYTYKSIVYTNVGLKSVIVNYTYGRYVQFGSQTDTPFGYVTKDNQYSTPTGSGTKKSMSKSCEQTAYEYWKSVRDFLNRNTDIYPLWNQCRTRRRFSITKISKH